jgi:hypothetical protein
MPDHEKDHYEAQKIGKIICAEQNHGIASKWNPLEEMQRAIEPTEHDGGIVWVCNARMIYGPQQHAMRLAELEVGINRKSPDVGAFPHIKN